eukprot:69514-Rhodomonas_salina.2
MRVAVPRAGQGSTTTSGLTTQRCVCLYLARASPAALSEPLALSDAGDVLAFGIEVLTRLGLAGVELEHGRRRLRHHPRGSRRGLQPGLALACFMLRCPVPVLTCAAAGPGLGPAVPVLRRKRRAFPPSVQPLSCESRSLGTCSAVRTPCPKFRVVPASGDHPEPRTCQDGTTTSTRRDAGWQCSPWPATVASAMSTR